MAMLQSASRSILDADVAGDGVDPPELQHDALVHCARQGDRGAFAQLWSLYASSVHSVVAAMVPRRFVEDVVQEVALSALSALPTLRSEGAFQAWLCAIARNRSRSIHARLRRRTVDCDLDLLPGRHPTDQTQTDEIMAALRALHDTCRIPLAMRLVAGLSGPEIATRLGMTQGSVRVNLCRGLKLLRQRLQQGHGSPGKTRTITAMPRLQTRSHVGTTAPHWERPHANEPLAAASGS